MRLYIWAEVYSPRKYGAMQNGEDIWITQDLHNFCSEI